MAIADASTPWALKVITLSDRLVAELGAREHLEIVADLAMQAAHDLGCGTLYGASEVGRRIVEEAAQRGQMEAPIALAKVLLVDGLLITGTNVLAAAERVRRAGAIGIAVFAALADPDALAAVRIELGTDVIALEVTGS